MARPIVLQKPRTALTLFILGVSLVTSTATATAFQAKPIDALDTLNECLAKTPSLSVVLLMDQSGSLRTTDPGDQRVTAATLAVQNLANFAKRSTTLGSDSIEVELLVAGFGTDFTSYSEGFEPLTPENALSVANLVQPFANRESDADTDYVRGLRSATTALAARDGCRMLVWFTDGMYDIASSSLRPDYEARIRGGSSAGTRADEYEQSGREWLCEDPDNIADVMRTQRIHLLTVALALEPIDERLFTERLTEGTDALGGTCGKLVAEAGRLGTFIEVAQAGDIVFGIDRGTRSPDSEVISTTVGNGPHPFNLPQTTVEARLVVNTGTGDWRAILRSPSGEEHPLVLQEGPFRISNIDVTPTWLSNSTFTLDLKPDLETPPSSWTGEWNLAFENAEAAKSEASLIGFLEIEPEAINLTANVGTTVTARFAVRNRAGTPPTLQGTYPLQSSAVIVSRDGGEEERFEGSWSSDGAFSVSLDTSSFPVGSQAVLTPIVDVIVEDVTLTYEGAPVTVNVVAAPATTTTTTTTLPPPPLAPSVEIERLDLGTLDTPGEARGSIRVRGGDVDGCVRIGEPVIHRQPADSEVRVAVATASGEAGNGVDCDGLVIGPDQVLDIEVLATVGSAVSGDVEAGVSIDMSSIDGKTNNVATVQIELRTVKPRSGGAMALWFPLLVLAGLGVPLVVAAAVARRNAVFRPAPNYLKMATAKVIVYATTSSSAAKAVTTDKGATLQPRKLRFVEVGLYAEPVRSFEVDPANYQSVEIPGTLSLAVKPQLFGGGLGKVACGPHRVIASAGSDNITTQLDQTWALIITDQPNVPDEGEPQEWRGTLVLFEDVSKDQTDRWTTLEEDVMARCKAEDWTSRQAEPDRPPPTPDPPWGKLDLQDKLDAPPETKQPTDMDFDVPEGI